jgi:hypothetical protein
LAACVTRDCWRSANSPNGTTDSASSHFENDAVEIACKKVLADRRQV